MTLDPAELDALNAELERARQFQFIPVIPVDDGQCLRDALAACLRLPPEQVPDRCAYQELDEWDQRVVESLGVRLEYFHQDEVPPREPWLAIVRGSGDSTTHAVACLGDDHRARARLAGYRIVPA